MISLSDDFNLQFAFDSDLILVHKDVNGTILYTERISRFGTNLVHYLAQPPIAHQNFNFHESKRVLIERQHQDHLDLFNMAPADVQVFKSRAELMSGNNEAYRIAVMEDPSVEYLIDFSYMKATWAILYALKHYLMHHTEKAKKYTGFLPYGSAVIAFVNSLDSFSCTTGRKIKSNPDYSDHVFLQNITNRAAQLSGKTSIQINNEMYLEGKKLLKPS
jgi:hypothetical protein